MRYEGTHDTNAAAAAAADAAPDDATSAAVTDATRQRRHDRWRLREVQRAVDVVAGYVAVAVDNAVGVIDPVCVIDVHISAMRK